jgi:transposase
MLKQAYEEYRFYQFQISACEERIKEQLLKQVAQIKDGDITDIHLEKKKTKKKNQFNFEIRPLLKIIVGVDLCEVDGINEISSLEFISEVGTDMTKWKSYKHLAAWCNVTPNTKITGGKIISSKMQKKKNRAGQVLRMSSSGLSKSKSPMGDYARKMKSRLGKKAGVVAIAHKMVRILYTMIKTKQPYNSQIIENDQKQWKLKRIKYMEKQLEQLKTAI